MIKKISRCRVCGNEDLVLVVDLGEQYLTGVFPKVKGERNLTMGPLRLVKCHGGENICGLLQLEHSYDSNEMYGENYGYRSGLNASMVSHLRNKVRQILDRVNPKKNDLVIDIGSNDGTTLSFYPSDLLLVGIDPTGDKFSEYYLEHINLIPDYFSAELIAKHFPGNKAKIVSSFSMFYDLESPVDFARQVAEILEPEEGIWVFEQSYMPLMLERNSYDTICHEHLEYYGMAQIAWIAEKAGLKIIDVELNDVNGGSFSVVAAHISSKHEDKNNTVAGLLEKEMKAGLTTLAPYEDFYLRTQQSKVFLQEFLVNIKEKGERIVGIGASTKGNVLLQYCEITENEISVVGDVNPDKFGSFTPGTNIPIQDERIVLGSTSDYLLVLPWHFRDFFIRNPLYKGRNLVFPLPTLDVVHTK
jgi:NDP-4-keto-2,6-dideoxyhexose 3-C-methyltransferase